MILPIEFQPRHDRARAALYLILIFAFLQFLLAPFAIQLYSLLIIILSFFVLAEL